MQSTTIENQMTKTEALIWPNRLTFLKESSPKDRETIQHFVSEKKIFMINF